METEWMKKEVESEPLLAGKPPPSPAEFTAFKELKVPSFLTT